MQIGGLQKLSLIDYPGKTAAVIFTQGCGMFCPYCHNPQLVYPELFEKSLDEDEVLSFLKKRQSLLQGAVITGGEPMIQRNLKDFIKRVKNLNYAVKLDTNGAEPEVLKSLIAEKLIDFIAMDIKAPFAKYNLFYKGSVKNIADSISIIKSSNIPHLFRTTYDKNILTQTDLEDIKNLTAPSKHITQECGK
ncbi:anaerobic ribonucleoside-triphosphate reductase activating protein [Endomicrobium proavitum]|uniref:Pyruvate formate-lyase activating enzyme n=1 Tax=Endomicrobium proavitum TaxID=1408281 RepID=A0A0G3WLF9_9BACT|nr:anaerobic ribonucleoside-triphosphate reductase activating protein [Endomicrobium proavitum]AKL98344.1 pyruvate formate-lyase activating enzyme [Endomicrobium proavitum]